MSSNRYCLVTLIVLTIFVSGQEELAAVQNTSAPPSSALIRFSSGEPVRAIKPNQFQIELPSISDPLRAERPRRNNNHEGYIRHPTFQAQQFKTQSIIQPQARNVYIAQPNPAVLLQYPFQSGPVSSQYVIPQQHFRHQTGVQFIPQQQYGLQPQLQKSQQQIQYPRFDLRPQRVRPVRPVYIMTTPLPFPSSNRQFHTVWPQSSYKDRIEGSNYLNSRLTPTPETHKYFERPPATALPFVRHPFPSHPAPNIEPHAARFNPYIDHPVPAHPAPYDEPPPSGPAPYVELTTAKPQPRPQPPRTRPYVFPTTTETYIEPTTTTRRPTTRRATTKKFATAVPSKPRVTSAPHPTTAAPRVTTKLAAITQTANSPLAVTRTPLPPSPTHRTRTTQATTTTKSTTTTPRAATATTTKRRRPITTTTPKPTTTTAAPATTTEPLGYEEAVDAPKYDETFVGQYYYGRRGEGGNNTFPLPSCFYNPSGYVCCNLVLNELMTTSFEEVKVATNLCNVHRFAVKLQKHSEKIFNTQFETVVSYEDFSQKIHFKKDLVCKIEIEGRFILAYATPENVEQEKIIPTVPSTDIQKDSFALKKDLQAKIKKIEIENFK